LTGRAKRGLEKFCMLHFCSFQSGSTGGLPKHFWNSLLLKLHNFLKFLKVYFIKTLMFMRVKYTRNPT